MKLIDLLLALTELKERKIKQIILDQITGIGKQRKRALLNHFGQQEQLNLLVLMN